MLSWWLYILNYRMVFDVVMVAVGMVAVCSKL